MRHRKAGRKLGRSSAHRQALTRNQLTDLLRHGRITTTEAKAKELRRWVERVVTESRDNDVSARRKIALWVTDREVSNKLFTTYRERYFAAETPRPGGYTRVIKLGPRTGDAAPMAIIEMVGAEA
jgi:large subunit ribosomal protein L17